MKHYTCDTCDTRAAIDSAYGTPPAGWLTIRTQGGKDERTGITHPYTVNPADYCSPACAYVALQQAIKIETDARMCVEQPPQPAPTA